MWSIKTRYEIHYEYMVEIEKLENEVLRHNSTIGRLKGEIEYTERRIKELEETAEMFKPKLP